MLRILIVSTAVPFDEADQGRELVNALMSALSRRGHRVDSILIPFAPHAGGLADQLLSLRLLDLSTEADRVICVGSPGCLVRHPAKCVWLIDSREVDPRVERAERVGLAEAQRIYVSSQALHGRFGPLSQSAEVLCPPLPGARPADGLGPPWDLIAASLLA